MGKVEQKLQGEVVRYLRSKGCFVLIVTTLPGVPTGTPDVLALFPGGGWAALEIKKECPYRKDGQAKKGAFRPLQQETVRKLDNLYYSRVIWPENWATIKAELTAIL